MSQQLRPMILGVTGGIACGKSLVVELFRRLGAAVLSADQLARTAVAPGSLTLQRLVEHFGSDILGGNGELDRAALGAKIFADPLQRQALNAIMHPVIGALAEERLRELASDERWPLIVYEAPLLFEAHAEGRVDAVLVVWADEEEQLRRLQQRDGLGRSEAWQRIRAQMPLQEKIARANWALENSGTIAELTERVGALFCQLATKKIPRNGGFSRMPPGYL